MPERSAATVRRAHWPAYLMEAIELGLFMISAGAFTILLYHPASPLADTAWSPVARRGLMGAAMGLTAIALIYSPLGRRSGAHMNPAVTLAFFRLGRVDPVDAACYPLVQLLGGTAGLALLALVTGGAVGDDAVAWVATVPGGIGGRAVAIAWIAELAMSAVLMLVVLTLSGHRRLAPCTGAAAGALVATFIVVGAPLSGMSINPARTMASSIVGGVWTAWWIYLTAPPLGMLLGAQAYLLCAGARRVYCAKLHHDDRSPCIFRCRMHERPHAAVRRVPSTAAAGPPASALPG